jgi:heme-degrading monooxygenase HmoA
MISRIWHGYTRPGGADAYETLLRDEIITDIEDRSIDGFREIQVLRRDLGDEVEFITVMWFDSLDAVRAFASYSHDSTSDPSTTRCASGGPRSADPIPATEASFGEDERKVEACEDVGVEARECAHAVAGQRDDEEGRGVERSAAGITNIGAECRLAVGPDLDETERATVAEGDGGEESCRLLDAVVLERHRRHRHCDVVGE